ncbi:MAG: protein-tyrosine kinase [Lachnospiraceae bacterium]|jgi:capsular polysaccharide biosynthesis protein|nr:protein-tyrosine kinase [Lachnospiraceae bacterium]
MDSNAMVVQGRNTEEIEIDLGEIFLMLWNHVWIILAAAVALAIGGFLFSSLALTPMYESETTVWIVNKTDENRSLAYSDLQTGTSLTKDYAELIKSRTVLTKVIETLGLEDSYNSLASRISVTNKTDTRILVIGVEDEDPLWAQKIADEVRNRANEHILDVTDVEAVNVSDLANLPINPISPDVFKWTLIAALLGAFGCVAFLLAKYLLDDTIKSSEDVERYLTLSTLAMIPLNNIVEAQKDKQKRHLNKVKNEAELSLTDE